MSTMQDQKLLLVAYIKRVGCNQ